MELKVGVMVGCHRCKVGVMVRCHGCKVGVMGVSKM